MATARERAHLIELRERHRRRLAELELQAASYGLATPTNIAIDLEDARAAIAEIDAVLAPAPIRDEVLDAMGADQQRKYLIALVMALQADFVSCRLNLSWKTQRWILAVAILQILAMIAVHMLLR